MFPVMIVLVIAAIAYITSEKNKVGNAIGVGLMLGIPVAAILDGIVGGHPVMLIGVIIFVLVATIATNK